MQAFHVGHKVEWNIQKSGNLSEIFVDEIRKSSQKINMQPKISPDL